MVEFILSAPFVLSAIITIAIIIAVLLEFEKDGWATTFFSLGVALTLWAYKSDIWNFVSQSPMTVVSFGLSYIGAGLIWSLFKWKFYINKKTDVFNEAKSNFISEIGEIKNNWDKWIDYLNDKVKSKLNLTSFNRNNSPEDIISRIIPQANNKKSLIVSWISYWPMSLGATLLNNPFRRFFEWIYGLVSGIYDRMSHSAAKNMMVGVEKNEDEGYTYKERKAKERV